MIDHLEQISDDSNSQQKGTSMFRWNHNPLFSYQLSDVNFEPLYQLWVKGSTTSSVLRNNIIKVKSDARYFLLHQKCLFTYIEGEPLTKIGQIRHAKYVRPDVIYYEQYIENKEKQIIQKHSFAVWRLTIVFSTFSMEKLYEETRPDAYILNYSIDYSLSRIYVLVKLRHQGLIKHQIVIIDTAQIQILSRLNISDRLDLIGPFKSGTHFLVNGNFYYQNSILRLDPTNSKHNLFQKYEDLIPMSQSELMIYEAPKISPAFQRILYIIKDSGQRGFRTAYIMPYLDDRKIILSKKTKASSLWTIATVNKHNKLSFIPINSNRIQNGSGSIDDLKTREINNVQNSKLLIRSQRSDLPGKVLPSEKGEVFLRLGSNDSIYADSRAYEIEHEHPNNVGRPKESFFQGKQKWNKKQNQKCKRCFQKMQIKENYKLTLNSTSQNQKKNSLYNQNIINIVSSFASSPYFLYRALLTTWYKYSH